ncbi:hypothetical protein CPB85DRAFT_1427190 [Mucidula mucida]|nr:hypothetical protein CPB85DRAFT_1427190 [Mucidula mucida]
MASRHTKKRPFSSTIDGDSDVEIVDYLTPSTPPRVRPQSSTPKKRSLTGIDYGVVDIEDDANLVNPALASTLSTKPEATHPIALHPDDLPLPTTPLRKKPKHTHIPALIISDDDDDDDDEYLPEVVQVKAHTRPAPQATNASSTAPLARHSTGTVGRQAAALPVTWEAWCNEHALKPNGKILQQQQGMYVMHYSDAISFFKFTKEDLAPLPYYSFPNSYVQSAAATGSAYRWVDLLYHAFRKEAALKCGELGLKPPGDPTEAAMFAKGKDLFKTKLEWYNDRYKKQHPGKERLPPKIRVVRANSGQFLSYSVTAVAARHRDLKDCAFTTTHMCEEPTKRKKGTKAAKRQ